MRVPPRTAPRPQPRNLQSGTPRAAASNPPQGTTTKRAGDPPAAKATESPPSAEQGPVMRFAEGLVDKAKAWVGR